MISNLPYSDQYYQAGTEWAELHAAASLLEESKSAVLSQRMKALGDIPVNRAELEVRASQEWRDYIEKMVNARKRANLAKVKLEYLEQKAWEERSREATERTQARL